MSGRYRTIVADPPWPITRPGNPKAPPYALMQVEEIKLVQAQQWAMPSSHLYLWTTEAFVADAKTVAEAWGFFPTTLLVWAKPRFGLGRRFRHATEFIWFCERGPEKLPITTRSVPTWFQWQQGPHSEKPDAFYDLVETVSPGPYLEMFARRARLGWDSWGDESLGTSSHAPTLTHVEALDAVSTGREVKDWDALKEACELGYVVTERNGGPLLTERGIAFLKGAGRECGTRGDAA